MLVKTRALDVVPRSRLVTDVTLTDLRVWLIGDSLRDHRKMLHIVARRCLMALGAILRARAGMPKRRNRPLGRRMTGGAVLSEKSEMFVFC